MSSDGAQLCGQRAVNSDTTAFTALLFLDDALAFQFYGSAGNLWALQAKELGAAVPSVSSSHRLSAIVGPGEGFAYL